ncbi:MAG: O-antigen ligase family protein [Anaerolineales bacterium]
MLQKLLIWIEKIAWAVFWLALPITSFRYFPAGLGGGTLVRPLSLYPLLILLIIGVIPLLIRRPIPKTVMTLFPFILALLASAAASTFLDIEPILGISVSDRILRALITLAIGIAYYFAVVLLCYDRSRFYSALRWMMSGFLIAFLWGSLQVVYILHFNPVYYAKLNRIQLLFSIRKLFTTRISGMTYEPNWFGEQISVLLLPWLVAAVFSGQSFFPWRWKKVTIEWFLLGWALLMVGFTFSRAAYINVIAIGFLAILIFRKPASHSGVQRSGWVIVRKIGEVLVVLVVFAVGGYTVGKHNAFFSRIWSYWLEKKDTSIADYFQYLGFGARLVYVSTAVNTFEAYPIFGVGPGNYAFFFEKMMPDQPLAVTPELLRIISPEENRNRLITPKNLYLRILAEGGLVGMASFLTFIAAVLGWGLYLWLSKDPQEHFLGGAAILGLVVLALAAFSFDSFALPNMWVLTGLIAAAGWQSYQKGRSAGVVSENR